MVEMLSEQPIMLLLIGVFISTWLFFFWTQFRYPAFLVCVAAVVAVTGLLIVVERFWVTDRESVRATLYQIAADIREDNWPTIVEHIHPDATSIRELAESEYARYHVVDVRITRVWEVTVDEKQSPPEAVAKFNVIVAGGERAEAIRNERVPRYVIVYFRKHQGRWKVYRYSHFPPYEAFRQEPRADEPLPAPF